MCILFTSILTLHIPKYFFAKDLDNDNRNKGDFSSLSASSSKREQHLARAPFVPFDTDLKYWEESKVEMASSYKTDSLHRFWKTNEHQESFVPAQVASSMRERCLRLDTEFVPVTQKCDAPMPDGRRCERMDREKCPFHGKIVERDASGKPVHKDDIERVRFWDRIYVGVFKWPWPCALRLFFFISVNFEQAEPSY